MLPRPNFERPWDEAERQTAISMLRGGASSTEIGGALRRSRNSIESRIHRDEELAAARPAGGQRGKRRPRAAAAIGASPASAVVSAAVIAPPPPPARPAARLEPPPPPARPKRPTPLFVPLFEVRKDQCMWPVEESRRAVGGLLFCAAKVSGLGGRYCPFHDAVARRRLVAEEVRDVGG